jgi:hypothetical protein
MKSRKKLRKNSNRKKNKINRKTIRKPTRKIYKKIKYGGQDPSISANKKLELTHRIKIGSLIHELREKLKNNENDKDFKDDILNLIHRVYVYKNVFATNLRFSNYDELYREQIYYRYHHPELTNDFFEKYKDLNKLLDRIESDFNLAGDDYEKTYLTIKKTESSSQLYNDNNDNIDDNNLEKPLL